MAGTCESPKDIAASIAQAEAVSSRIMMSTGVNYGPVEYIQKKTKSRISNKDIIVIGGGISGLQTAVGLANLNYNVSLLYKDSEPGGIVSSLPELYSYLSSTPEDAENNIIDFTETLISDLKNNKKIRTYPKSIIRAIRGELGNFSLTFEKNGNMEQLKGRYYCFGNGFLYRKR